MADSLIAPSPVAARQAAPGAPARVSRPVLLITGVQLAVLAGPGGRPVTALIPPPSPAPAGSTSILTMGQPGHLSEVPADALPFLGRGLDPALFSVAALQRAEHGGRLPVRVSYRGQVPSLPGVTITSAAAGTAEGFVTARSAPRFGAALHRQYLADHDRAAYGTDGLFGHGVSITLAGAPVPAPIRPRFVMRTLTIHATSLAGRPDNGDVVFLTSADDTRRGTAHSIFRDGVARVSVPVGRYWATGEFMTTDKVGLVFPPQFTVPAHGLVPRVQIAGQSATSVLRVSTPRPAAMNMLAFTTMMRGRTGPPTVFSENLLGVIPGKVQKLAVAPASFPAETGRLETFTQVQLLSPAGARPPYVYNLDFPGPPDRVPGQRFTVQPSSLATVTENFFQDQPSSGLWATSGGTGPELAAGVTMFPPPQRLPGQRVEYLTGDPSVLWQSSYIEFASTLAGGQHGPPRTYRPGEAVTEDWGRYPLHPASTVNLAGPAAGLQLPSAARAGDLLTLAVAPFSDSALGHEGSFVAPDPASKLTERYEVDQDGARLASGDARQGVPPVRLGPGPSRVRFTLSARRTGPHYILSPASTTTWQWRSQRDPSATVPPPWTCLTGSRAHPALTRRCAVQPMMTLAYQVAGLGPAGATAPGRQQIGLSARHLQLAASPAITRVAVQASFDDGKTWHSAQVAATGTAGRFSAEFTAPAGAFVTLRTTAADAAGGLVTETIARAYRTAAAPATAVTTAAVQRPAGPAGFIQPPCARPKAGQAQCFLAYRPKAAENHALAAGRSGGPRGLGAAALRSAYRLRSQGSPGQTVAVSIAFHTPHLAGLLE
jgi:hypothetical protein